MAITETLSDGRACVVREESDSVDSLIEAMQMHAHSKPSEQGEMYYLSITHLGDADVEKAAYNSIVGVRIDFSIEKNPEEYAASFQQ